MKRAIVFAAVLVAVAVLVGRPGEGRAGKLPNNAVLALNRLRDEINRTYGFVDGVARVNRGPCGRFAKAFYESWNRQFPDKVRIAFVMSADRAQCHHVLVRLPDGSLFDGGNGVIAERALVRQFIAGSRVVDMQRFDFNRLDRMSLGLDREYPLCPDYSDAKTGALIEQCLAALPRARPGARRRRGGRHAARLARV